MIESSKLSSPRRFFISIMVFIAITNLSVFLDIPIIRQISSFIFLTFLPGMLIVFIFKLNRLELLVKLVLSMGLSVAFLMLFGLAINWIYFGLGYDTPLSTLSLVPSFSVAFIILGTIAYIRNREAFSVGWSGFRLNTTEKAFLLIPAVFPILSIYGMHFMNTTGNNIILMALLLLIPANVILLGILKRRVTRNVFLITLFLITISVLLLLALRTNHIIGMDSHYEYGIYQTVLANQCWQILTRTALQSCLCITLLPAIYQSFVNIDSEYLFRLIYPLIASIIPLVTYIIARKYVSDYYAFLASFFIVCIPIFMWVTMNTRVIIAILFFALFVMVVFHDGIRGFNQKLLFIIFLTAITVSHYSTSFITLFILILVWIGMRIFSSVFRRKREAPILYGDSITNKNKYIPSSGAINGILVFLFLVTIILWHDIIMKVPFKAGVEFIVDTYESMSGFFLLETRSGGVEAAFGSDIFQKTIPQQIEFIVAWATIALLVIGLLFTTVMMIRKRSTLSNSGNDILATFHKKLSAEYLVLSLVAFIMMVITLVFPHVTTGYSLSRVYLVALVPLSVFLVIGAMLITKYLRIVTADWLIIVVLVVYFLCGTGAMYQIFDSPKRMILNSEGAEYDYLYVHDQEVYSARWLKEKYTDHLGIAELVYWGEFPEYIEDKAKQIYTDMVGSRRLENQGVYSYFQATYPISTEHVVVEGYIYLRYYNVIEGKLLERGFQPHDLTEYDCLFEEKPLIYTNGGSEVWGPNPK